MGESMLATVLVPGTSVANGLNNAGVVVGQAEAHFPFVWDPDRPNGTNGEFTRLPTLPIGGVPGKAAALAINNSGDIVGYSDALDGSGNRVEHAVMWSGGQIIDLHATYHDPGDPFGLSASNSRAVDINDGGSIVGTLDFGSFFIDRTRESTQYYSFRNPVFTGPCYTGVNNNGDIVGFDDKNIAGVNFESVNRGFIIPAGGIHDGGVSGIMSFGTLMPDPSNAWFEGVSRALALNENGLIVGTSDWKDFSGNILTRSTKFFSNGSLPMAILPMSMHSSALAVSSNDHVVGSFGNPGKAYSFHSSTGMIDLTSMVSTPGMTIDVATGVNASGQVSALATIDGTSTGVLISPCGC